MRQFVNIDIKNCCNGDKGLVYAVNLENDRSETHDASWARGVVSELAGRGRLRVTLPDTGRTVVLHWSALRYLHPKFTTLSALVSLPFLCCSQTEDSFIIIIISLTSGIECMVLITMHSMFNNKCQAGFNQ